MSEGNDNSNVILGIIFVFILIVGGLFLSYYFKLIDNPFADKDDEEETQYFDMRIMCPVDSNYVLRYKSLNISSGTIRKDSIEIKKHLVSNRDYELICWDDDNTDSDYYLSSRTCTNKTACSVFEKRQGDIQTIKKVYDNNIDYTINVSKGTLEEALLCFSWRDIYKLTTDLERAEIPMRLYSYLDVCYDLGTMSDESREVKIIFDKLDGNTFLKSHILDKCYDKSTFEKTYELDCGVPDYTEILYN